MRKRPLIILLLAGAHMVAPLFNFIIQAFWARTELFYYIEIYFQPENFQRHWFNLFAPFMGGILILIFRKWSYYLYMMVMLALAFVSFARFLEKPNSFGIAPILVAYATNAAIVIFLLRPKVRSVYFDPRMRWWESAPRHSFDVECIFESAGVHSPGMIRNISRTGLFLRTAEAPQDDAIVKVKFQFEGEDFDIQGQIVHHNSANRDGVGIKFLLNPKTKKHIKNLIGKLQDRDKLNNIALARG